MTDKKVGYNVFRKYKGVLESHIDKKFYGVVDKFYDEGILTEEQKTTALDKKVVMSSRISNLKKIMRDKALENDTAFEAILRAFRSIEGVDMKAITTNFDQEKKKSVAKHKSTSSESASTSVPSASHTIMLQSSPIAQDGPESVLGSTRDTAPHCLFSIGGFTAIPGSPSVHRAGDTEDHYEFETPIAESGEVIAEQEIEGRAAQRLNRPLSMIEDQLKTEQQQVEDLLSAISQTGGLERTTTLGTFRDKYDNLMALYNKLDEERSEEINRLQEQSNRSSLLLQSQDKQALESQETIEELQRTLGDMQNVSEHKQICADQEIKTLADSWQQESFDNVLKDEAADDLREKLREKQANVEKLKRQLLSEKKAVSTIKAKLKTLLLSEKEEVKDKKGIMEEVGKELMKYSKADAIIDRKTHDFIERQLMKLRDRPATTGGSKSIKQ